LEPALVEKEPEPVSEEEKDGQRQESDLHQHYDVEELSAYHV
jgi:hypothetical protein